MAALKFLPIVRAKACVTRLFLWNSSSLAGLCSTCLFSFATHSPAGPPRSNLSRNTLRSPPASKAASQMHTSYVPAASQRASRPSGASHAQASTCVSHLDAPASLSTGRSSRAGPAEAVSRDSVTELEKVESVRVSACRLSPLLWNVPTPAGRAADMAFNMEKSSVPKPTVCSLRLARPPQTSIVLRTMMPCSFSFGVPGPGGSWSLGLPSEKKSTLVGTPVVERRRTSPSLSRDGR